MPIKTFPMGIVDTGAARAQGNRNALAEIQQVNIGQKMQQRNALAPARQAQANLKTDSDRVNFMVKALGTTTDQPSWTAAKQTLIGSGMPQDAIPDQFDENVRDQIIGKATGKETGFTLSPGQQRFDPTGQQIAAVAPKEDVSGGSPVQSSQFLTGGGVRIIRKDGSVSVVQPTQEEITIIKNGEERGVNLQQQRSQGRELGKDAAQIANKAFDQTGKIRANILTLRKVIKEVGDDAETGPLAAKMPSFRAASVRLDTLRNQLGLDVVGSVTFGALSEGELNLALSTALPIKLNGPELVQWANDKIAAQEKLSSYLEDQAIFLSKKGNTAADWLEKMRAGNPQTQEIQTGGQPGQTNQAPQQAIDFLMQNNTPETQQAFQSKYGYLP